jgi:hypothetical protein
MTGDMRLRHQGLAAGKVVMAWPITVVSGMAKTHRRSPSMVPHPATSGYPFHTLTGGAR